MFLYTLFIKGLSLKIIIHKVKGNINIVGFILKASLKLNEISAKKALPRPHPGQGIPVINKNGHEIIFNKCVIQTYKKNSIIGKLYLIIKSMNNLIYCFIVVILIVL